ncbi:hypothetical protein EQH18_03470 [Streptococcus pneumoniae]|nr:hypothetical protein EQH18_03470 [Streptococcus pneumoniae]
MGLFFYTKIGSIISIGDLPTTNIIEPTLKDRSNPVFLWRRVNEFKSIRYYRFKCSPSLC